MPDRPKIVVVGSANTDLTLRLPHLPAPGESVIGTEFIRALGGKGANQAVAAARMGAEVSFVCRLGNDDFGRTCYQTYQQEGIDTQHITWDAQAPTGVALIFINASGENMLGVVSGANRNLCAADIERAGAAIRAADLVMMQLEVPAETDLRAAQIAHRQAVPVMFNPAPAIAFPLELLNLTSYFTPNETELELTLQTLAKEHGSPQAALDWLRGSVPNLVITLGAQGCRVMRGPLETAYPAFAVQAVDSTAAGDTFNSGLAVSLARGLALPEAVRYASAAGAISVTRYGAMNSCPTHAEIEAFLAAHS